jgi:predicted nucleotidyltransferase
MTLDISNTLCKMRGGSHSYGLNTPLSDEDFRGVFLNTEIKTIIGLERHEHQQNQGNGVDEVYTEVRNFFKLLRQGNTQAIELLFNNEWIERSHEWGLVQSYKLSLIDSTKLFNSLRGYMQGELKLANGERTGKLGGKRKEAIEKYGFSPKNFVQLLRLAFAGRMYFEENIFPVNIMKAKPTIGNLLLRIKTQPELYSKDALNNMAADAEAWLVEAYEDNPDRKTIFDENLANDLCFQFYYPLIEKYNNER